MNKKLKIITTTLSTLVFLTACGSASSDAKKIDVAPAPATMTAKAEETKNIQVADASATVQTSTASSSKFIEGKDYVTISPAMQTDAPAGKVEVVELMWLGCPHCYSLEPVMEEYQKNIPPYVSFKQVPATLNPSWTADAGMYYIAEVLDPKGEKKLITKIFDAIHKEKRRINNPSASKRFFVKLGFTEKEVDNAKESIVYRTKMKRAQEISAASQSDSVPAIIINGKYRTSPYMAVTNGKLMKIIDFLTRKEKQ